MPNSSCLLNLRCRCGCSLPRRSPLGRYCPSTDLTASRIEQDLPRTPQRQHNTYVHETPEKLSQQGIRVYGINGEIIFDGEVSSVCTAANIAARIALKTGWEVDDFQLMVGGSLLALDGPFPLLQPHEHLTAVRRQPWYVSCGPPGAPLAGFEDVFIDGAWQRRKRL